MSKYRLTRNDTDFDEDGDISEANTIGGISDGFHTFDELYEHRITLFIAFCKHWHRNNPYIDDDHVWRSKKHSDGSSMEGWFIMGLFEEPGKQITYHLPLSEWDKCDFAETLEKAPEFDGHTSQDVLERIAKL